MKPVLRIMLPLVLAWFAGTLGCSEAAPDKRPPISQKVRVENLQARIEKSYRLSDTENVKILMVPGWPFGERCVIYSNSTSSTMQCREITPSQQ